MRALLQGDYFLLGMGSHLYRKPQASLTTMNTGHYSVCGIMSSKHDSQFLSFSFEEKKNINQVLFSAFCIFHLLQDKKKTKGIFHMQVCAEKKHLRVAIIGVSLLQKQRLVSIDTVSSE